MNLQELSDDIVQKNLDHICKIYLKQFPRSFPFLDDTCCSKGYTLCEEKTAVRRQAIAMDIGGDMNHVHRVYIQLVFTHERRNQTETNHNNCEPSDVTSEEISKEISVIVKIAPKEVLYMKEEGSKHIPVDPSKIKFEHSALCRFNEIQPNSVPTVFTLDKEYNAIIMEDMQSFIDFRELIEKGEVDEHTLAAVESTLEFIGKVHKSTWLSEVTAEERTVLFERFENNEMRRLMAMNLFNITFDPCDKSNKWNPLLTHDIESFRSDPTILLKIEQLKHSFLNQNDCLCHGDLACDNVLVRQNQFRVLDMEFCGIGLRAYDVALFLQMVIFQVVCHYHCTKNTQREEILTQLHKILLRAMAGYELGIGGKEKAHEPSFVEQVCGLIACEMMWKVFGAKDFGGRIEPEKIMKMLLSLAKMFLLHSDNQYPIGWNIDKHLTQHNLLST